jgi:cytidyltransferase-like protein
MALTVMGLDQAARLAAEDRASGLRTVLTNGCFDVLHAGHVCYLQAAARLGDILVVGLNDDASVRRAKGPDRPLNRVGDRAAVLAALRPVDRIVVRAYGGEVRLLGYLDGRSSTRLISLMASAR